MKESEIQVYGYRWVVLLLFVFTNITMQILWISFATVTLEAAVYYGVKPFDILFLSTLFMIVYIPVTFLVSWVNDKYDIRIGVGIGALLGRIFRLLRIFTRGNFVLLLIFELFIAIGQPFIVNSMTKLSANWFPEDERTIATGISTLSQLIGIMIGMVLTPFLVYGLNFESMNLIYGLLALISGLLYIIFAKNKPPTPPSIDISTEKVQMLAGLKHLFKSKYFIILTIFFFIGLGVFNMITTYIELIVHPKSPSFDAAFAGMLGAIMLVGGIIGCIIVPGLSDKYKKRKIFLIICFSIASISLLVISISTDALMLLIFGFIFGFGLLSAAPVALEYAVEITRPVPETTSTGMLLMIGSIGGIVLIIGLESFTLPTGDYLPALILQSILLGIAVIFSFFLSEETNT